jgi:hypothetical protein
MLNTKYLLAPGKIEHPNLLQRAADSGNNIIIFENTDVSPRVFPIGNIEIITDAEKRYARLNDPGFAIDSTAIIEKELGHEISMPADFNYEITRYEPNVIDISVEADKQTLMVLSEVYYPAGWKAFIDDIETEIYKTNHLLRSIVLPAGNHSVSFRLEPESYYRSLWLMGVCSTATYMVLAIALFRKFKHSNRESKQQR